MRGRPVTRQPHIVHFALNLSPLIDSMNAVFKNPMRGTKGRIRDQQVSFFCRLACAAAITANAATATMAADPPNGLPDYYIPDGKPHWHYVPTARFHSPPRRM